MIVLCFVFRVYQVVLKERCKFSSQYGSIDRLLITTDLAQRQLLLPLLGPSSVTSHGMAIHAA